MREGGAAGGQEPRRIARTRCSRARRVEFGGPRGRPARSSLTGQLTAGKEAAHPHLVQWPDRRRRGRPTASGQRRAWGGGPKGRGRDCPMCRSCERCRAALARALGRPLVCAYFMGAGRPVVVVVVGVSQQQTAGRWGNIQELEMDIHLADVRALWGWWAALAGEQTARNCLGNARPKVQYLSSAVSSSAGRETFWNGQTTCFGWKGPRACLSSKGIGWA